MDLRNKKILMVMAHCDDEIICGWPIFQEKSLKKKILIASSDLENKERVWCSHRKFVFREVCKSYNISQKCLNFDSCFSMNTKNISFIKNSILDEIDKNEFDFIFTHNYFGEYLHPDHIFLFDLISNNFKSKTIISDIDYTHIKDRYKIFDKSIVKKFKKNFFKKKILNLNLDQEIFDDVKEYYKTFNVWTWSNKITKNKASVYLI